MTKKKNTLAIVLSALVGALGGVVTTAFSMGAERQSVYDKFMAQEVQMKAVKISNAEHKEDTQKEIDRLVNIMVSQNTAIQNGLLSLTETVTGLRGDVQVLNALMARIEQIQRNPGRLQSKN